MLSNCSNISIHYGAQMRTKQIAALETMLLAWDEGNEELFCDAWEKLKVGDYRLGIDTALAGQTAESNFEQPHARAKNVIEELKIRVTPSEQLREAKTNGWIAPNFVGIGVAWRRQEDLDKKRKT